jgi:hypothetical protein
MQWKKGKGGLIEPADDIQYKMILERRQRHKAEENFKNLQTELEEIKRIIGLNR